jgi:heme/copper-type cytochrome/quinol oxidase subunit 2
MDYKDKKNNYLNYFLTVILIILSILMFIFMVKYFRKGNITNTLPRLTLNLYDDLDAFMQYDY